MYLKLIWIFLKLLFQKNDHLLWQLEKIFLIMYGQKKCRIFINSETIANSFFCSILSGIQALKLICIELNSKTFPVLPSLIFLFHHLPSPVHSTRFSFHAIFILLSSNNINLLFLPCHFYLVVIEQQQISISQNEGYKHGSLLHESRWTKQLTYIPFSCSQTGFHYRFLLQICDSTASL